MSQAPQIGFYIRELRQARGLSVAEVAEACGTSEECVFNWEVNFTLPDASETNALQAILRRDGDTAAVDWSRHHASLKSLMASLDRSTPKGPLRDASFWLKTAKKLVSLTIDLTVAGAHAGDAAATDSLREVGHAMRVVQTAIARLGKSVKMGHG